jgi:hypothetical protein
MEVRTLKVARQILTMAGHPDKCIIRHMHDMNANAGGIFSFRSNPPNPTMLLYRLLKSFRGVRLATSVVGGSPTAGALAMQQLMLELAGDLDSGRFVMVIANFASTPAEIALNISDLRVMTKAIQSTVLDLVSLRNESLPCRATVDQYCVELKVKLPSQSITVVELAAEKVPVQQRCRVQLEERFVENATFIGLANYTPSCSQEPPLCREHLPPPCVDLGSKQKTECTNRTTPLNLTVSLPSPNGSAAPPTAMLVRLGLLAKKYHSPGPPPENTWYLNTDIGRWRLDIADGEGVEFDGAAFVELRLLMPSIHLATRGGWLTLALSFVGNSTGDPPTAANGKGRGDLSRPLRGPSIGNTTIPPVRTLMFASVVLESRSCDGTTAALKADDGESPGAHAVLAIDRARSLGAAAPPPAEAPAVMTAHILASTDPGARCINGQPASVFAPPPPPRVIGTPRNRSW